MPTTESNGLTLAYEVYGSEDDPVILLIHGLGVPSSGWPAPMVKTLVGAGYRVVTFDNRDVGRSTLIDDKGTPNLVWQFLRSKMGLRVKSAYDLWDMAKDTVGLLDSLKIDKAHVVGASMGGMIAQCMAITTPERLHSLTSIMSTTGNRDLPAIDPALSKHFRKGPISQSPEDRRSFGVETWQRIGSPDFPSTNNEINAMLDLIDQRGTSKHGFEHQLLAIMATDSRCHALGAVQLPTLVVHGDADPLVPLAGGQDTAKSIPSAKLEVIEGMGHDFPAALHDRICAMLIKHMGADGSGVAPI